jgi:hypothetical protein
LNEATDFICGVVIHIGNYLKIKKIAWGWFVSMGAIAYWMLRGWETGYMAQTFWHGVSFCLASYGFWSWRKND